MGCAICITDPDTVSDVQGDTMAAQGTKAPQVAFPSTICISCSSPTLCSATRAGKQHEPVLLERPEQIWKHCVQPVIIAEKEALLGVLLFA